MEKIIKIFLLLIVLSIMGVLVGINPPAPLFDMDYSTVVKDKDGNFLRVFLNDSEQWRMMGLEKEIPEKLEKAIILFEDKRFYSHYGLDFKALSRAFYQNISRKKRISGASTITMQLARLSKAKRRTISNKIIEIIQALKIERKYSKKDILKMYINNAPYGGNIIGYRAASLRYFGKEAKRLTWAESAVLAVLPNSPSLINPNRSQDKLIKKRDRLLKRLYEAGNMDKESYELSLKEKIPRGQISFPFYAPHFSREIYNKYKYKELKTTIEINKQKDIKNIVRNYAGKMSQQGIYNAAVIVVEKESGKIRAYIGSQDYMDRASSGMIDGVEIKRSSGSILKPFLYALCIDDGYIQKSSLLEDIPINYGAYSPYNANRKFKGLVRVSEALTRSLNAPAVRLLQNYGTEKFYNFLKEIEITTLFRTAKAYGLPLIIGGAEVKLVEITNIYRMLGNYGEYTDLSYIEGEKIKNRKRVLSKGASYLTLDILKGVKRPGLNHYWKEYDSNWDFSWKTGTSYGNRDAWAVGLSNEWVIGVWVGNFTGKGENGINGIGAAAPLLFKVFNYLPKKRSENSFEMPKESMKKIRVSKLTGYRLSKDEEKLTETVEVFVPKEAKALKKSPYEKIAFVNKSETEELCSLCWGDEDVHKVIKEIYPPTALRYLRSQSIIKSKSFNHRDLCPSIKNRKINIVYPEEGAILYLPKGLSGSKGLKIKAERNSGGKLYWYLDGKYLGENQTKDNIILDLDEGWHNVYISDEYGNNRRRKFYIKSK